MKDYDFATLLQALSDEYSSAATGIGCGSWIGPIGAVEAELRRRCESSATLEAELAAQREAVRVLADEVRECFVIFGRMKPSDMMDHLHPKTKANPLASAAITDAAKAREG